jgi:hypothetical protein
MICFAKPGLTEDLYTVHKEEFSITHLTRPSTFIRDKPILSSERMLHKDYNRKGSVAKKKSLVVILKGLGARTDWR